MSRVHAPRRASLQIPLALLAGLAQAASLAWPGGGAALWWLQLASMAALAWLLRPGTGAAPDWRRGAWLGGGFALAWLAGTFWWLFISLHVYGGLPAALALAAVLALAAFLASYYAAAMALFCQLAPRQGGVRAALLFASLWLLAELARGSLWTGFPWGAGGYAHVDGPLAALARFVGVYGVGAVAAMLAMLGVQLTPPGGRKARPCCALLALLALIAWATLARRCAVDDDFCRKSASPAQPALSVELLQGNIPQDEKFQSGSGVPLALGWYALALREARAQLVIAPETAIPLLPRQLPPGYLEGIAQRYAQGAQAALLGVALGDEDSGYSNSVIGLNPASSGGARYRYDKQHLVPFGEFTPPFFKWFTAMLRIPLGDFRRGALRQSTFDWAGQRIAPNICYEDLFGEEIGAGFIDPERAPTLLVNLSNIGWFGDTVAIDQHLHISRMRAIEFERPMLRATNTGATAIIDHRGQVVQQLERHTRGVLSGQVQGRGLEPRSSPAITPYAWWVARHGLWPLWALAALAPLCAWAARRWRGPERVTPGLDNGARRA